MVTTTKGVIQQPNLMIQWGSNGVTTCRTPRLWWSDDLLLQLVVTDESNDLMLQQNLPWTKKSSSEPCDKRWQWPRTAANGSLWRLVLSTQDESLSLLGYDLAMTSSDAMAWLLFGYTPITAYTISLRSSLQLVVPSQVRLLLMIIDQDHRPPSCITKNFTWIQLENGVPAGEIKFGCYESAPNSAMVHQQSLNINL